ncbi:MAG TPA: undecaprenyl-diphosphate phosphatase [Atribacteraceae bacterium]|nr:undecaprenyl-diphosphate phosphatase [Atribacteraceae bacterium]
MTLIESLGLGLIQGLTEFFPISSSAHLILLRPVFGFGEPNLWFDVFLHGGTWLAVLFYLIPHYRRLWEKPFLIVSILLATIPAGAFGLLFEEPVEQSLRTHYPVIITVLIGLGVVFLFVRQSGEKPLESLGPGGALFIGLAQALALLPGVSRSGITLLAALALGLQRKDAVLFSFFLSLTTIGGALAKGTLEMRAEGAVALAELLPGFLVSLGSGFFACLFLLRIVAGRSLWPFGLYRIIFGVGIMLFLLFSGG